MKAFLISDILLLLTSYLLGSIPFGLLMSWIFTLQDPRKTGSHSIGATNILRSGHKMATALTLTLDALKGGLAVLLALHIAPSLAYLAGLMAVLGHIFPLWLRFRGGKGVATALGVMGVLSPLLALMCILSWLLIAFITRYSSLASLVTVGLSPLYVYTLGEKSLVKECLGMALILGVAHRRNIGRLLTGRETKIGASNSP